MPAAARWWPRRSAGATGLLGLADRLAPVHGELRIESPAGGGTLVAAAIPLRGY